MAIKSEAQKKAVAKYNAKNYTRLEVRVKKGEDDIIKAHAAKMDGGSVNAFINRAIAEQIARDNKQM